MEQRAAVVFDVGKTHPKLTLWGADGRLIERRTRANRMAAAPGYRALDRKGVEAWLIETLTEFARSAPIGRIIPVAHGAAAALLSEGSLVTEPMDYEDPASDAERRDYEAGRDQFSATGSPALPAGLNLGMQLHRLEAMAPWPSDLAIVPWPRYWAWRLSGVTASELSSLGCHSDLWRPFEGRFSDLAKRRGWSGAWRPCAVPAMSWVP